MKKLKKSLNTLSMLSRTDMRNIVGGYGPGDNTLWCGCATYSCRCNNYQNPSYFSSYMCNSQDYLDMMAVQCGGGGMTCSC